MPLLDADIRIATHWLCVALADALLADLQRSVPWEVHRIKLFGREVDSPRLSCWIGDANASYAYSGTRFEPHPWPGALRPIRDRLVEETGIGFNSVLANLYRDGSDYMGWHSDSEAALGRRPVIASLSLGGVRRFVLKRRDAGKRVASERVRQRLEVSSPLQDTLALELPHGSLLT
ncbi:MAG: alpha-ketoglutarate-dependent dioxygenase AlkB, partial [Luteimonas sp.]